MRRTRVDDAWSARNFRACSRSDFWSGEKSKFMAGGSYGIARGGATALGLALGQRRRYPRALHDPDEVKDSCLARPRLDHVAEVGEMLPLPGRGTQAVARRRGEVESRRPHRDAREAVEGMTSAWASVHSGRYSIVTSIGSATPTSYRGPGGPCRSPLLACALGGAPGDYRRRASRGRRGRGGGTMDARAFEAGLTRDGYQRIETKDLPRGYRADSHAHDWSVRALVLAGEITLTWSGTSRTYAA